MLITLDSVVTQEQPTSVTWNPPRRLGFDGLGTPIYGPYRTCSLGFARLTTAEYHQWFTASQDGGTHLVRLPHPQSGASTEYTCFVQEFAPRMNNRERTNFGGSCQAGAAGVDITLSRIEVT